MNAHLPVTHMSLPPIDASFSWSAKASPARAVDPSIEAELDALHLELGVKRGAALTGTGTKPELTVPVPPLQMAVPDSIHVHAARRASLTPATVLADAQPSTNAPSEADALVVEPAARTAAAAEPFATLTHAVLVEPLLSETQRAASHYLDTGLAPPDDPTALCSTHWLPLAAGSWPASPTALHAPRHVIEAAVMAVARAAASARPSMHGATVTGVEWWLQEQWPEDAPKEHHTDKVLAISPRSRRDDGELAAGDAGELAGDAGEIAGDAARDGEAVPLHPLLSTVTYLSTTGGPTAVFMQRFRS
jgi:hypothetical protein